MAFTGGIGASQDSVQFDVTDQGVAAASSGWISWLQDGTDMTSATGETPIIISGPTVDLLRIEAATNDQWFFQYYDGSVWQNIGAVVTTPLIDDPTKYDIFYNIADSGGEFSLYVNGAASPIRTFSGDTLLTADSTIQKFAAYSPDSTTTGDVFYVAAVMFDSADTRDLYLAEIFPLQAGQQFNDWPNRDEADIDDGLGGITIGSTINTSTADDRVTFDFNEAMSSVEPGDTIDAVSVVWVTQAQNPDPLYVKPMIAKNLPEAGAVFYDAPGSALRPDDLTGTDIEIKFLTWNTDPGASVSPTYENNWFCKGTRTSRITASTTASIGGGSISNSVDGLFGNGSGDSWFFTDAQAVSGLEIKWDFGAGYSFIIDEIRWYQSLSDSHGTWKVQGSPDDSTWTDLSSNFTLGGATVQLIDLDLQTTNDYRYYRLLGVSGNADGSPWLQEVEFRIADTEGLNWTAAKFDNYEIGVLALSTA